MTSSLNQGAVTSLTAQPQQTFFREATNRHTNFSLEIQEIPFNNTPNFGTSTTATISQAGTLLTDMFLEITLPPLANNGSNGGIYTKSGESTYIPDSNSSYLNWVNSIGFAIIDEVSLEIAGTVIDNHSGLWLEIWNELTDKNHKEWEGVRKYKDRRKLKIINYEKTTLTIPLKFFFCLDISQALPITEINSDSIKVKVSLNSLNSLINRSSTPALSGSGSVSGIKLFGEFATLEQDEITTLRNSEKIFNIPVLQYVNNVGAGGGGNFSVGASSVNFTGTIKEFVWVFRHKNRLSTTNPQIINSNDSTKGNDQFNFSNTHINSSFGDYEIFNNLIIKIRNTEIINENSKFFGNISRLKYHSAETNKNIYLHSFALNPEDTQPSGDYSFQINNDTISFSFSGMPGHSNSTYNCGESGSSASANNYQLSLFAITYKQITISNQQVSINDLPFSINVSSTAAD